MSIPSDRSPGKILRALSVDFLGEHDGVVDSANRRCMFDLKYLIYTVVLYSYIQYRLISLLFAVNVGARVAAAIVAYFFISVSFSGMYIWTVELFPTVIRYSHS